MNRSCRTYESWEAGWEGRKNGHFARPTLVIACFAIITLVNCLSFFTFILFNNECDIDKQILMYSKGNTYDVRDYPFQENNHSLHKYYFWNTKKWRGTSSSVVLARTI